MRIYISNVGFREVASEDCPGTFVAWMLSPKSAQDLSSWADYMGVTHLIPPDELHCTIAYDSNNRPTHLTYGDKPLKMPIEIGRFNSPATRILGKPGSEGALVTTYDSNIIANRHRHYEDCHNLKSNYPDYLPYISISYNASAQCPNVVRSLMQCPYQGPIGLITERIAPANH